MTTYRKTMMLVLTLVGAAAACSRGDDAAFDDDAGSGGGGRSSTSTGNENGACVDFGDPCTACEIEACEASFCACYGNTDCSLYAACTFACPDGDLACFQACNTQYPNAISDAVLLNDCAADACPGECADYPLIELTGCQRCTYESCESAMNTCLANPACTELLFCVDECGADTGCQNACYATYPAGLADATPVGMCAQSQCATACFGG